MVDQRWSEPQGLESPSVPRGSRPLVLFRTRLTGVGSGFKGQTSGGWSGVGRGVQVRFLPC